METILRLLAENPESLGEVVKTYITKYKEPVYDVLKELMINDNIQLLKNIQKSVNNTSVKKSK